MKIHNSITTLGKITMEVMLSLMIKDGIIMIILTVILITIIITNISNKINIQTKGRRDGIIITIKEGKDGITITIKGNRGGIIIVVITFNGINTTQIIIIIMIIKECESMIFIEYLYLSILFYLFLLYLIFNI
jgi:hypothetical protein